MKVRQYMTEKLITAKPSDSARQVYFLMRENRIRHVPVIDDDRMLIGLVSDRDLRRPDWADEAIDVAHQYRLDDDLKVDHVMTTNVETVHVYDTLHKAANIFIERQYGALPVLNKENQLVGIVSPIDLLKALDDYEAEAHKQKKKG